MIITIILLLNKIATYELILLKYESQNHDN